MTKYEISINAQITVKLTEFRAKILNEYFMRIKSCIPAIDWYLFPSEYKENDLYTTTI